MARPVGSAHPTFVDRGVSGEIYRFDRPKRHMLEAAVDETIKTCFCPKQSGKPGDGERTFRELALVNAVNRTGKSLSDLGNDKVHNPQSSRGFVSQRQATLWSSATRGQSY